MVGLRGKPNCANSNYNATGTGYWLNGEWQLYHYYHLNMAGYRVSTTASIDQILDAYATVGTDKVKVLVGEDRKLELGTCLSPGQISLVFDLRAASP